MNKMKKSIISATIRFQSGGIENSCHSIAGGCWSFLCSVAAGTGAAAEAAEAVWEAEADDVDEVTAPKSMKKIAIST